MKYEIGKNRIINKNFPDVEEEVVHWEVIKIKQQQTIYLKIISTNSSYLQGIRFAVDVGEGYIEIDNLRYKEIYFMVNKNNMESIIKCSSDEGLLSVYNIFQKTKELYTRGSQMPYSGMLVQKKGNKFIFRCNDTGYKTTFDSLVFEITLE